MARSGPVKADLGEFTSSVEAILADPRGWSLSGAVRFRRVTRGGRFTVTLAAPAVVGSYGGCSPVYSCRSGRRVLINDVRWRRATPTYRGLVEPYRQMVVNHEVGHALGFGHAGCSRRGGLAPIMQQQSKSLRGCRRNPWPLPGERRALGRRLGVTVKPLPPEVEPGERGEGSAQAAGL